MTAPTWVICAACNKPAVPCDMQENENGELIHDFCDEPAWQRCTGCDVAVHLNDVEYTGPDMTPWCPTCDPEGRQG